MARRIEGVIAELAYGKPGRPGDSVVDIRKIVVRKANGATVALTSTSARRDVAALLRQDAAVSLYTGGPFFWFLPSKIFGVRSAAGDAFYAPRAIFWIPGALLILLIAVPMAMLPITLLLFPLLILASVWMMLISWSGMGARSMFKRDQRRAAKGQEP